MIKKLNGESICVFLLYGADGKLPASWAETTSSTLYGFPFLTEWTNKAISTASSKVQSAPVFVEWDDVRWDSALGLPDLQPADTQHINIHVCILLFIPLWDRTGDILQDLE